jgi:hypothetical protein
VVKELPPPCDNDTAQLIGPLRGCPVLEAGQHAVLLAYAGGNPVYADR